MCYFRITFAVVCVFIRLNKNWFSPTEYRSHVEKYYFDHDTEIPYLTTVSDHGA